MQTVTKAQLWTGRILSGIAVLFLTMDGVMKFVAPPEVLQGSEALGYAADRLPIMGTLVLTGVALYLIPRTSVLGAIFLTGFLGGAVATHVRVDNPLFSHVLFPTYVAAFIWGGLLLRDARLRVFLPFAKARSTPVESERGITTPHLRERTAQ
ncbi:DoxX family protein [Pyxidicoccus fallax]|uniref:DoxX family protein n=1 Tax=Pyxidicoccus fallax TaxID=394095 RepID=A0A848LFM3_9BACT|nr:DoxX family protein [Pyxidicoccus fallax]NMO15755.1 DoxX family protein [Pyxidicoccus fallax]NPC77293.1 DoxX family protein [Pyxidicoccus fallax]